MEFNKPVSNPMMVGSIELLKAEDTPEHRTAESKVPVSGRDRSGACAR